MNGPLSLFAFLFFVLCSFDGSNTNTIQIDLALTISYDPNVKENGNGIVILNLTNKSTTRQYKIILPGDGSENAWREPYVYFSADFKKKRSEVWEPLPYHKPLRCGNYDPDWQNDTLLIAPGQTVQVYQSFFWLESYFTVNSTGTIRMTAHYDYAQGLHSKRKSDTANLSHTDIPKFSLTSDTVVFQVKKRH